MYDENDVFVQYVTKNIEDIKVGDFVYSYDTITGEVSLREVTATFVREVDHINYLTILDEFGNEQVIATTDSHPFWVVTDEPDLERAARGTVDENGVILYHENIDPGLNGFWVEAKDLREGDVFLGANGELLTLVSQERVEFEESITVYNFTVDGNHNYFVIAAEDVYGQTCVLVHNAGYEETKKTWIWRSPRIKGIQFGNDSTATITLDRPEEDTGRIYILFGHGGTTPHIINFEKKKDDAGNDKDDKYLLATFIMCHAKVSNELIPPNHQVRDPSQANGKTTWFGKPDKEDPNRNENQLEKVLEGARKIAHDWLDDEDSGIKKVEIVFKSIERHRSLSYWWNNLDIFEPTFPPEYVITITKK